MGDWVDDLIDDTPKRAERERAKAQRLVDFIAHKNEEMAEIEQTVGTIGFGLIRAKLTELAEEARRKAPGMKEHAMQNLQLGRAEGIMMCVNILDEVRSRTLASVKLARLNLKNMRQQNVGQAEDA